MHKLEGLTKEEVFIKACFSEGGTIETRMRKTRRKLIRIEEDKDEFK